MGSSSMDMGLEAVWNAWLAYRKGKKQSRELLLFETNLMENIQALQSELKRGIYRHGPYSSFWVRDKKKRTITVAGIRDRIVHRLLYDHLVSIFDSSFLPDVWSCRKRKGLHGAVARASELLQINRAACFWRGDIRHFFQHIDHTILKQLIRAKVVDPFLLVLIDQVIDSHVPGIPIGNLTSQVFANIYMDAFDQWVLREINPLSYLRYGDDFLIIGNSKAQLLNQRNKAQEFLNGRLTLPLHPQNTHIGKLKHGIHFLGLDFYPTGKRIRKQSWKRVNSRLNPGNFTSYWGFVRAMGSKQQVEHLVLTQSEPLLTRI